MDIGPAAAAAAAAEAAAAANCKRVTIFSHSF